MKLMIYRGNVVEREIDLDGRNLRIGRSEQNDVVLQDATKAVSRQHAELRYEDDRYVLVDRESENGLWVGNRRMPEVLLEPNEPVTVGPFTLMLADGYSTALGEAVDGRQEQARTAQGRAAYAPAPAARRPPPPLPPRGAGPSASARSRRGVSRLVVFAAFAVVVIALLAAGRLFRRAEIPPTGSQGAGVVPPPPPPPVNEVKEYLSSAQQLFEQKDYDGARTKLGQAMAIEPGNTEAADLLRKIDAAVLASIVEPEHPNAPPGGSEGGRTANPHPKGRAGTPAPNPREQELTAKYEAAKAAADRGSLEDALRQFSDLDRSFKDVPVQMGNLVNEIRAKVDGVVDQAKRQESAGELIEARRDYGTANSWQELLRRHQLFGTPDETVANATKLALVKLEEKIKLEGDMAFEKGKMEYNFRRYTIAMPSLDRAYRLLPEADPRRKLAKEWLDASKAK